jgi:hypothetical protein
MSVRFEPIIGRYMHLDLFGRNHRIYVEEAGEGTPLLCPHTAGADGRQYRALMNDKRITSDHRVIAFDRRIAFATGCHGPPEIAWQKSARANFRL